MREKAPSNKRLRLLVALADVAAAAAVVRCKISRPAPFPHPSEVQTFVSVLLSTTVVNTMIAVRSKVPNALIDLRFRDL